jgi:isoamylase
MDAIDPNSGDRQVETGRPLPLGASLTRRGANFALFSRHASGVELLLFESRDPRAPYRTIRLDPAKNRTGDIWHIELAGIRPGQCYAYRVDGPYQPESGMRFNRNRILADPYACAFSGVASWDFERAKEARAGATSDDGVFWSARSVVVSQEFDWAGTCPPRHPWSKTVIYETHVRGLTIDPSSTVRNPGTYRGMIEKIPYFKELGITAVELMPVQEFNQNETSNKNPLTGERLSNYWGYNPVGFRAPKESYSSGSSEGCQVLEFKEMVRSFHQSGIEVILDVVFNHTAERDEAGPTLSFRGLENSVYYMLADDRRRYKDFSGCLNTINCNHPVVSDLIIDCLRTWVFEMRVDGFRFDLASILARGEDGAMCANPPLLERIAADPVLRDVKLIAEPWDAAGAFQVGSFYGGRWSEWNSLFRDDVRRFWLCERGLRGALATRICGSSDPYRGAGKTPANSINFVTCHDGFTLNDLVSYSRKRNAANAHDGLDGTAMNFSHNHGSEGPSVDPEIEKLRLRQIKNLLATLLLSRGVPMLLGGDEFRRTQGGNNNAYCQDDSTSWYDWRLLDRNRDLFRFTRVLIELRNRYAVLSADCFYADQEITWFDPHGLSPAWEAGEGTLGCIIHGSVDASERLALLFNAEERAIDFRLPESDHGFSWLLAIDSSADSPNDIHPPDRLGIPADPRRVPLLAKSLVLLIGSSIAPNNL